MGAPFTILLALLVHACNAADSIYDFTVKTAAGTEVPLSKYESPVTLIVNTASKCGFTPQYKGLGEIHDKYGGDVEILAFPCNSFFAQEPGSDVEIQEFVKTNYGLKFPVGRERSSLQPGRGRTWL
jgi:glutathione peroxidase